MVAHFDFFNMYCSFFSLVVTLAKLPKGCRILLDLPLASGFHTPKLVLMWCFWPPSNLVSFTLGALYWYLWRKNLLAWLRPLWIHLGSAHLRIRDSVVSLTLWNSQSLLGEGGKRRVRDCVACLIQGLLARSSGFRSKATYFSWLSQQWR